MPYIDDCTGPFILVKHVSENYKVNSAQENNFVEQNKVKTAQ